MAYTDGESTREGALTPSRTHHFVVGHELEDAGGHPAPELQRRQDRREAELVLTLDAGGYGTLFAVYGPELSKDKCMEEGTHVQHGGLGGNKRKSRYLLGGWAAPRSPPRTALPAQLSVAQVQPTPAARG